MFTISENVPQDIQKAILGCTDKNGKLSSRKVASLPLVVKEWFEAHKEDMSTRALFNLLKDGKDHIPFCEYCHTTQLTPYQYEKGHYYCCNQHAQLDSKTQKKISKAWEKYDGGHPLRDKKIRKKVDETCMEKFGTIVAANTPENQKKIKENYLKKYGVDHPWKSKEVLEKRAENYRQTCMEKYGVENTTQVKDIRERAEHNRKLTVWGKMQETAKENRLEFLSSLDDYLSKRPFRYRCLDCNTELETDDAPFKVICRNCHPKREFVSNMELELLEWVKSIYSGEIITSDRSLIAPYELDILIPEKKVALEFDGVYWHSSLFKEADYHQSKTIMCINQGYRLIHVPELVWNSEKRPILQSIIKHALGISERKIGARKCKTIQISAKDYQKFLTENHIHGPMQSKNKYGLVYENELVAVLGYGPSRFKQGEVELHRFCAKMGTTVQGGFSKLIADSGFPVNGTAFIDLNYFKGDGYKESGFAYLATIKPSYVWHNPRTGESLTRYQTQKHKLGKLLGDQFDQTLSESLNMELAGYFKINDSGTYKVEKTK